MGEVQKGDSSGMTLADQVEILRQARAGLHMWKMDTTGIDRLLAQHGVDVMMLPHWVYGDSDYCGTLQAAQSDQ